MTFFKNIRSDITFIIFLILLAVGILFYNFVDIPKGLHYDEIDFGRLTVSLENQPYTPYSPLATGHATLYFYILLFSFNLFGINTFALRFPAAFFTILSTVLFYIVMKLVFKKHEKYWFLPLLLTFIFITLRWYFNFGRFAFEATFLIFLELASLLAMILYKERKQEFYIVISGIFAGLAYNSYTPGRFFFFIPFLLLISEIGYKNWFNKKNLSLLLYFVVPFVLLILPLSIYLSQHPDTRVAQQFFLMNSDLSIQEKLQFVWQNVLSTLKMFHIRGDVNGTHNYPYKPALNPVIGSAFLIGLIISIKNWKNSMNLMFLAYFVISLFPTILTYPWENPHMLRTITVIPSIVYFVGRSIVFILEKTKTYHIVVIPIIMSLVILSSMYELRTYFLYHAEVLDHAFRFEEDLNYYIELDKLEFDKIKP